MPFRRTGARLFGVSGRQLQVSKMMLSIDQGGAEPCAGEPRPKACSCSIELLQVKADLDVSKKGGRNTDTLNSLQKRLLKPMPERTVLRLMYPTSSVAGSGHGQGAACGVDFVDALRSLHCQQGDGFVFIGIGRTDNTTGCGFHICGQFIPTMERIAVDMNERDFKYWNSELLTISGNVAQDYFLDGASQDHLVAHRE